MRPKRFFYILLVLAGCSNPQADSESDVKSADTIISQKNFDSIFVKTGNPPHRKNVQAMVGNEKWVSLGFAINVYVIKEKKIYSIYSTNGYSQLTMNYSGPEKPGIVNTGSMFEAGYREKDGTIYTCSNGFIEITKFDLTEKKISGRFKLFCTSIKNSNIQKNFDEAIFTDLTWQ